VLLTEEHGSILAIVESTQLAMPIFEFECRKCGLRFEELLSGEVAAPPCPDCGAEGPRRLIANVSPPARQPRGSRVRSDESRRRDREAGHRERLAGNRAKRERGEQP
jgi:putative FmdB family regulatory protein